jgi:hypothetical protein
MTELAKSLGITQGTVTLVLQGKRESDRVWTAAERMVRQLVKEDKQILGG